MVTGVSAPENRARGPSVSVTSREGSGGHRGSQHQAGSARRSPFAQMPSLPKIRRLGKLTSHAGGFIGLWTELAERQQFPS